MKLPPIELDQSEEDLNFQTALGTAQAQERRLQLLAAQVTELHLAPL
jgi:hypothetical protein